MKRSARERCSRRSKPTATPARRQPPRTSHGSRKRRPRSPQVRSSTAAPAREPTRNTGAAVKSASAPRPKAWLRRRSRFARASAQVAPSARKATRWFSLPKGVMKGLAVPKRCQPKSASSRARRWRYPQAATEAAESASVQVSREAGFRVIRKARRNAPQEDEREESCGGGGCGRHVEGGGIRRRKAEGPEGEALELQRVWGKSAEHCFRQGDELHKPRHECCGEGKRRQARRKHQRSSARERHEEPGAPEQRPAEAPGQDDKRSHHQRFGEPVGAQPHLPACPSARFAAASVMRLSACMLSVRRAVSAKRKRRPSSWRAAMRWWWAKAWETSASRSRSAAVAGGKGKSTASSRRRSSAVARSAVESSSARAWVWMRAQCSGPSWAG